MQLAGLLGGGDFPFLARHFGPDDMVLDFDALFEFALATLLDGLEAGVMASG